jgi:type I restriction-modification system DNA methylase subunit
MIGKRERSENLDDGKIEKIVQILDGWSGKLTWNKLIDEIALHLRNKYTRQTLAKHTRIKSAYELIKENKFDTETKKIYTPIEINVLIQELEKVKAENKRLKKEKQDLLAQYARWAYNSYAKGVTKEDLDKPLPIIDRR